jgi:hypothetical protein
MECPQAAPATASVGCCKGVGIGVLVGQDLSPFAKALAGKVLTLIASRGSFLEP